MAAVHPSRVAVVPLTLFDELKRRNVIRVALAYLAGSWLLIQVAGTLFPLFELSAQAVRVVVIALAIGFVPALVAAWALELTPAGLRRDAEARDDVARSVSARHMDRAILLLLALGLAYFAVDKFVLDPARDAAAREAARAEGRAEAVVESYGDKSIAVLPFVNLSDDPGQEYFSDGVAEEILNLLARLPGLRVISRSTAFTFKGQDITIPEAAQKMNVAHILEGSVRTAGGRVRITAQLIEAASDTHLWSETFDREIDDLFAVQDEIAARVADALAIALVYRPREEAALDAVTHDRFLRAHHLFEESRYSAASMDPAIALHEEVLAQAPEFQPAALELFHLYLVKGMHTPDQVESWNGKARDVVERLLVTYPDDSKPNSMRAWLAMYVDNDPVKAATHWERSSRADPYDFVAMRPIMRFFMDQGRHEESLALAEYILERDPACTVCLFAIALNLRATGRALEAAQRFEDILKWREPDPFLKWQLGVGWLLGGDPRRALGHFQGAAEPLNRIGRLMALHDLGEKQQFESEIADLLATHTGNPEPVARVFAWTGRREEAFQWMQKAVEFMGLEQARASFESDLYTRLHDDPRWFELMGDYRSGTGGVQTVSFNPTLPASVQARIRASAGSGET